SRRSAATSRRRPRSHRRSDGTLAGTMVLRRVVIVAALAGCAGQGAPAGRQPSWRGGATDDGAGRVVELRPGSGGAEAYNADVETPVPRSRVADAPLAAVEPVAAQGGRRARRPDGRLFQAADELARVAPEDAPLAYGLIEFALHHAGLIEPSPHLVVIRGGVDEPEAIAAKLEE